MERTSTPDIAELERCFQDRMWQFEQEMRELRAHPPQQAQKTVGGGTHAPATSPEASAAALATQFFAFKDFILKALKLMKLQIETVTQAVDDVETRSRSRILLLHGVEEGKGEDIRGKIVQILTTKMGLATVASDVEHCQRLGAGERAGAQARPRAVIVRFGRLSSRGEVWRAKSSLKGSGITVSEFLTKRRHEVFEAARKHFGVRQCWTSDGRIVVQVSPGTNRRLTNMAALKALIAKYPSSTTPIGGGGSASSGTGGSKQPGTDRATRSTKKTVT